MTTVSQRPQASTWQSETADGTLAKPDRSARHEAGEGRVLQPPLAASIRHGSAAQPLAGSRGAAPSPTCCLQHNSRSILRFSGNGG